MTISLEEHVARAIFNAHEDTFTWDDFKNQHPHYMRQASAAIAAVHEREGAKMKMHISRERLYEKISSDPDLDVEAGLPIAPNPELKQLLKRARKFLGVFPPESDPKLIEEIEREFVRKPAPDPAEAMRAKTIEECEAIVRAGTPIMNPHSQFVCRILADRIAALKGKGE